MICKNCSAEYDDGYSFCPSCGEQKQEKAASFTVEDEEVNQEYTSYKDEEKYETPEYENENAGDLPVEEEGGEEPEEAPEIKKSAKKASAPMSRTEKKASALIIMILCIVAATSVLLAVLNIKTEKLEPQQQPPKAVALTKLSVEEETLLEKELSDYFSVFRQNFDWNELDAELLVSSINPADKGNVYYRLNCAPLQLETSADPAMRFADEYGEYAYIKVAEAEMNKVLARFGVTSYGDVNTENCYYYDGFYYYGYVPVKATPIVSAEIIKSKKVLDGSFYVECYFYVMNGTEAIKSDNCYIIVEKQENSGFGEYTFVVKRASNMPLFTDAGNPTAENSGEYVIEKKVIEGRTNDGTVYSRYTIEYPVFSGKSSGIETINAFYSGMISTYELKAQAAQSDYETFVSQGGNVAELPLTETVVTRVTYSDDEKISCVEKISAYVPEIPVKQEESTTSEDEDDRYYDDRYGYEASLDGQPAEQEPVKLFTRTVEAYTFDKQTGDFISKDSILGKDYIAASEILYRIYNSYDYTAVIPETEIEQSTSATVVTDEFGYPIEEEDDRYYNGYDDYYGYGDDKDEGNSYGDDVPEDEKGFGTSIYESACCFTKNGFTFWYVEEEGFVKNVTIPFEVVEKLAK